MNEVRPVLAEYPRDCQPAQIESLGSAGGLSGAQFWRVVAPRDTLVVRRWPTEHPTLAGLQFVHSVLEHAGRNGVRFVPIPVKTAVGATIVPHDGHLWEMAPWLSGVADYERAPRVEKLRAAMSALATFHLAVADFDASSSSALSRPAPSISQRLARLRALQSGGMGELRRAVTDADWPELAPLAREFLAQLPRAIPTAIEKLTPLADVPQPQQPCIRDIWHDHVLFEGDTVTGLIDFGAMQIDTPATDVARLLGSLVGDDAVGWREGLAAYAAIRPLAVDETRAVFALDSAGTTLAGVNWIRWIYVEGRQFEDRGQVIARFRRLLLSLGNSDKS